MKKYLLTLLCIAGLAVSTQAQTIKSIPFSKEIRERGNGWHKFQFQGVTYDVEIAAGGLVQGNLTWLDGTTYSGSLGGIHINGKGTYTWADGSRYEGSFRKNQRYGKGSMIAKDGSKWSGKWKNDKKNGKGKMFDAKGELIKTGVWQDDKLVVK